MQPSAEHLARCRLIAQVLDQHAAALTLYAAQWTAKPEDCVQEALIELASCAATPEQPVAWLYMVVRRRALNAARTQRRRAAREQTAWQARLRSASSADRTELLDAVAALSDLHREIVLLKVWGNLTFSEMAEVLAMSSSKVHREYQQAIAELRTRWDVPCENMSKTK